MMKLPLALALFALPGTVTHGQTPTSGGGQAPAPAPIPSPDSAELRLLLQRGLFEEEASRDLGRAAAAYSALLSQYDTQRTIAATALFRLAEIRVKQNNQADAILLYQRLLKDFPGHESLAPLARERLAKLKPAAETSAPATPQAIPENRGTSEEDAELVRLRKIAKDSPDLLDSLIDTPNGSLSPLENAANKGWDQVVEFLLETGVKVNRGNEWSAINQAAMAGHKRIVELLLAKGGNAAAALRSACEGGRFEIMKYLLARGTDPSAPDPEGRTALFAACHSQRERLVVTRFLLEKGANPNLGKDPTNEGRYLLRPLAIAAASGDNETVKLLLEYKADPNADLRDPVSLPLSQAVRLAAKDVVATLLNAGARVDIKFDGSDLSAPIAKEFQPGPLLNLALRKNPEIAKMLIEHEAPTKGEDAAGNTSLHLALLGDRDPEKSNSSRPQNFRPAGEVPSGSTKKLPGSERMVAEMESGRQVLELCKVILAKMDGSEINHQNKEGQTPLHLAMARGDLPEEFLRSLIASGADPLLKDKRGLVPLDYLPVAKLENFDRDFRYGMYPRKDAVTVLFRLLNRQTVEPTYLTAEKGRPLPETVGAVLDQTVAPASSLKPPPTITTPNGSARISAPTIFIPLDVVIFRPDAQQKLIQVHKVTIDPRASAKKVDWPATKAGDLVVLQQTENPSNSENTAKWPVMELRRWLEASGAVPRSEPAASLPAGSVVEPIAPVPPASSSRRTIAPKPN